MNVPIAKRFEMDITISAIPDSTDAITPRGSIVEDTIAGMAKSAAEYLHGVPRADGYALRLVAVPFRITNEGDA